MTERIKVGFPSALVAGIANALQLFDWRAILPGHEVSRLQMALAQASVAPFMGRSLVAWRFIAGRCISLLS